MITVALIGPDGAGKTTIGRRVLDELPVPVRYLYMGVNADASNRQLLTTRLARAIKKLCGAKPDVAGPPPLPSQQKEPKGFVKRTLRTAKSLLSLGNRLAEEWYRQAITWVYQWQGNVVLYDRHYFVDYFAYDVAPCEWRRPIARRIHGFVLNHLYPKPHLIIYLDAPSEVLFARKGEGTIEALERRRAEYLQIRDYVPNFVCVDANRSLDEVTRQVIDIILEYRRPKHEQPRPLTSLRLPCDAGIELSLSGAAERHS